MATFKATKNASTTSNNKNTFKATRNAGYDRNYVYNLQYSNKSALDIINEYNKKVQNGEWLSQDDRTRYQSAVETYAQTGANLRGVSRYYGTNYTLDEEKGWWDAVSSLKQGYTGINDFYNQFSDENQYNLWDRWGKPIDDVDYDKYINLGRGVSNPSWYDTRKKSFGKEADVTNMVTFAENNAAAAFGDAAQQVRTGAGGYVYTNLVNLINMYMTDEEKARYNYYIGKGDTTAAQEYLSYMEDVFNQRAGGDISKQIDNTLLEPFFSFITGMQSGVYGIENFVRGITGKEGVPTSALQYANYLSNQNNKGVGKIVNDLANTTGNMFPSLVVGAINPTAGAITMGVSAGGNAYAEMLNQGYSVNQARAYGIMTGASEALLSKVIGGIPGLGGGDGVFQKVAGKVLPGINNAAARVAIQIGGNMLDEALEEGVQTALDPVFKWAATLGEAELEKVNWEEIGYSALLGGLSAGIFGGVSTIPNSVSVTQRAQKAYGGDVNNIVADALNVNPNNKTAQMAQTRLDKGKSVSGLALNEIVNSTDRTKVQSAIESRLTELGETGDISKLSELLTKKVMGEELSLFEKANIKDSNYGKRVLNELNPNNIMSDQYSTAWSEGIGTRAVNPEVYNLRTPSTQTSTSTNTTTATQTASTQSKSGGVVTVKGSDGNVVEAKISGVEVNGDKTTLTLTNNEKVSFDKVSFSSEDAKRVAEIAIDRVSQGVSTEVATAMINGYDGTISPSQYTIAFNKAYELGQTNSPTSELREIVTPGISQQVAFTAYELGKNSVLQTQANSDIINTEQSSEVINENGEDIRLRNGSEWNGSANPDGQISTVEGSTGQVASRGRTGRIADSEAARLVNEGRKVRVADFGIPGGSKTQMVVRLDDVEETTSMKKARAKAEARGKTVRYFVGDNLHITDKSGNVIEVRGYIKGDYVYVRADHPYYTADQIMEHELGHDKVAKGEVDVNKVRERLEEIVGKDNVDAVAEAYIAAYIGSDLTVDEIWEECICDSLGDMNIFASDEVLSELMNLMMPNIKQAVEETTTPNKTRGSPEAEGKASREIDERKMRGSYYLTRHFSGFIDVDYTKLYVSDEELGVIAHSIKTGYGRLNSYRTFGGVYTTEAYYLFRYNTDDSITIINSYDLITETETIDIIEEEFNDSKRRKATAATLNEWLKIVRSAERGLTTDYSNDGRKTEGNTETDIVDGGKSDSNSKRNQRSNTQGVEHKVKYSREIDSSGNELTKEQAEYFKGSKVRDNEGNLLVVYHGSANKFTEFKHSKIGVHGTSLGKGFYFTEDTNLASSYYQEGGQLLQGYLDIKKPLVDGAKTISKTDVTKLIKAICESEAKYLVENDGSYDNVNDAIKDTFISNYVNTYNTPMANAYREMAEQVYRYNDSDADIIGELINGGAGSARVLGEVRKALGYDGVIFKHPDGVHEFVAFESNQFKNIDNKNPTSNPDIRFSREIDTAYLDAVKSGDMETAQKMVDEAAKKAGYNYHLYHGTDADFTKFDLRKHGGQNGKGEGYGIYLAANREIAAPYGKNVINSYTKFNRLAEGRKKTLSSTEVKNLIKRSCELEAKQMVDDGEYDSISEALKDTWVSNVVYTYDYSSMEQVYNDVSKKLWSENDNDGDLINEIMALSGAHYDYNNALKFYENILTPTTGIDGFHYIWGNRDGSGVQNDIYLAFNSEQIKSADPVTYDDDGNVIPLSERFNSENNDIRFSRELEFTDYLDENATEYVSHEVKPISNRELLVNSLESTAQNEAEKEKLAEYKGRIEMLNAEEKKLAQLKSELKELTFGKGAKNPARAKALREEIVKTENRINLHDKKLLQLESTKSLKDVLEREKTRAYKRAAEKGREALHRNVEGRHKTILRNQIKSNARKLATLLNKGNKDKNIKLEEQPIVRALLDITDRMFANDDDLIVSGIETDTTPREDQAIAKFKELYTEYHSYDDAVTENKEKRKELRTQMNEVKYELSELLYRERSRISKAKANIAFDTLIEAYEGLKNEHNSYLSGAFDEDVLAHLRVLKENVGDTVIQDMTIEQLDALYKAVRMIQQMVVDSNKMFRNGQYEDLEGIVSPIFSEIEQLKGERKDRASLVGEAISKGEEYTWKNLRPVDMFKRIGSKTLDSLFWDVIKAQDKYAQSVSGIAETITNARKKHGYKNWDIYKTQDINTIDGKFKVTLGEMMSIYAYSKREQASKHILEGGFVHEPGARYKGAKGKLKIFLNRGEKVTPNRMNELMVAEVAKALTAEQRAYVDELVDYITKYGEKGNEVSRILYGIDLFTEKAYFPLKSSRDFLSSTKTEIGKTQTTSSLANTGMTKPTTPNANNPIVLRAFDDVILEHLDTMSKYNAYVIPIKNLRKVYDWVDKDNNVSFKTLLSSKLGNVATDALQTYITDINGGIPTPQGFLQKLFSRSKAASVMAKNSVWVQQYFSIIRAMETVDPKYFAPFLGQSYKQPNMKLYEEMKRYAPITIIKEMGGFDVGSNKGLVEYIGLEESKLSLKKANKILQDSFGFMPSAMDKLGWMTIWKAVKKEVAASNKYKVGSTEYFEACGNRMAEVVTLTQVYDSVNARSGFMRSKSALDQFATSFMGEPTVIVGRVYMSAVELKRAVQEGKKTNIKKASSQFVKVAASVAIANAMTTIAKSLIYAGFDDDDDETYGEKYVSALASAFADDINVFGYLPYARDISSIIDGFSVDRPDMQLIEGFINGIEDLFDGDMSDATLDEVVNLLGSFAFFANLPIKNIYKDIKGLRNTIEALGRDYKENLAKQAGVGLAGGNWITKGISALTNADTKYTKSQKLYDAMVNGDEERIEHFASTYKTYSLFEAAIRKSLRDNDPRMTEAAQAYLDGNYTLYNKIRDEIVAEGIFNKTLVTDALKAEINYLKRKAEEVEK